MNLSDHPLIQAYNMDCMEFMRDKPDNYYDLAIVDPPYGVKIGSQSMGLGGGFTKHLKEKPYKRGDWDNAIPTADYFNELFRVSKNQVVWGGNYMVEYLPPKSCWIFWDKKNGSSDFGDGELAWTSFSTPIRVISFLWAGCIQGDMRNREKRIHPTQKPQYIYRWLLKNYAKEGDKILDTHGGSMSSAIACHMEGFDLDICELDEDYFNDAVKRFKLNTVQGRLF